MAKLVGNTATVQVHAKNTGFCLLMLVQYLGLQHGSGQRGQGIRRRPAKGCY